MNTTADQLLHEFEALPEVEKHLFARLILRRLPPIDAGEITDGEICAAGDQLAASLEAEESHEATTR